MSPLSTILFQFSLVCSLSASFDAAGEPLAKRVLLEYKAKFLNVLAVYRIYRELCEKKVIDLTVEKAITNSHNVDEARQHLFDHMRDYGTLDTLRVFCDVITSEEYNGIQAMQDFGAELKRRLAQGEWPWVDVVVCCLRSIFWDSDFRERARALDDPH